MNLEKIFVLCSMFTVYYYQLIQCGYQCVSGHFIKTLIKNINDIT